MKYLGLFLIAACAVAAVLVLSRPPPVAPPSPEQVAEDVEYFERDQFTASASNPQSREMLARVHAYPDLYLAVVDDRLVHPTLNEDLDSYYSIWVYRRLLLLAEYASEDAWAQHVRDGVDAVGPAYAAAWDTLHDATADPDVRLAAGQTAGRALYVLRHLVDALARLGDSHFIDFVLSRPEDGDLYSATVTYLDALGIDPDPAPVGTFEIEAFDADQGSPGAADDTTEFVRLAYSGADLAVADGHVLVFYDGATETAYHAIDLVGLLPPGSTFIVGNPGVPGARTRRPTRPIWRGTLQNGPDAIALYWGHTTADFPEGTGLVFDGLVSAVVYEADGVGTTQSRSGDVRDPQNGRGGPARATDVLRSLRGLVD